MSTETTTTQNAADDSAKPKHSTRTVELPGRLSLTIDEYGENTEGSAVCRCSFSTTVSSSSTSMACVARAS